MAVVLVTGALSGCAGHRAPLAQPWRFEARPTHGVVRVLPLVTTARAETAPLDGYLGAGVPWMREWLRDRRTDEVARIPDQLGTTVPGAINGALGADWDGQFLRGRFAPGSRARVKGALNGHGDLDEALSGVVHGEAALVTWLTDLSSHPLTDEGFAGEIVQTDAGPVVLDLIEEPFLVEARVGLALVAADGEVVVRYTDAFSTVVSARRDSHDAASVLADALAGEVAKVWAVDPRLEADAASDPDSLVRW